ncbi:MAG TPA: hypothetical protein VFN74_25630 [Chloroflexota bacterium]|nr:hypothetical protein [Chloroflexota bacterium]
MAIMREFALLWWFDAASGAYAVVASIAVARGSERGAWAAYLGLCPTQSDSDAREVARTGAKLPEAAARAFAEGRADLVDLPYRH